MNRPLKQVFLRTSSSELSFSRSANLAWQNPEVVVAKFFLDFRFSDPPSRDREVEEGLFRIPLDTLCLRVE
jgi:hypothetical protein